jgi:hypothetical protein
LCLHPPHLDHFGPKPSPLFSVPRNKKYGLRFDENITDSNGLTLLKAPYYHGDPYILKAYYKGILVYGDYLRKSLLTLNVVMDIELNDFSVEIRDSHNLPPGVEITPLLLGLENNDNIKIIPEEMDEGTYNFKGIPSGKYKLQITYANFIDEKVIHLPIDGNSINIPFSAKFDLFIDLFDIRANSLTDEDIKFKILREGMQTFETGKQKFSMPPAHYTITAYHDEEVVGTKQVELTSNRNIKLVTKLSSQYPMIIIGSTICFIGMIIILIYMKILSYHDLLTFLAIAFIILTLIQPWWELYATSSTPLADRSAQLLIYPQVMIESTTYNQKTTYDIAEMPEIFIDFLGKVVIIIYTIIMLLGLSFISLKLRKRKYFFLLHFLAILLMIVIVSMFFLGISKVTEASIGPVQGESTISIALEETVTMQASWGFSSGFYLIIIAAILIFISLLLEVKKYIKKGT